LAHRLWTQQKKSCEKKSTAVHEPHKTHKKKDFQTKKEKKKKIRKEAKHAYYY
jgi:hypothetical protein